MKKICLGSTGIEVSELCFGALPIGPCQKDVPVEIAADVIATALNRGITFIDTAQLYKTYPHIRKAMEKTNIRPIISSKSPADTYEGMEASINECLEELAIEYVDIFLLHAARCGTSVFDDRSEALRCMQDYKKKGKIKAIGISTHDVNVTRLSADRDDIDVVFPIINKKGMGILNGSREEMEEAIEKCFEKDKAVFFMKALAGGTLIKDYKESMDYILKVSAGRASIALGMVSEAEVEMNIKYFEGGDISKELIGLESAKEKQFIVLDGVCKECGKCLDVCHSSAIQMINGKAVIDSSKCLTCGYCVNECNQFAIRMI